MKNVCLYFKIHQPFRLKRYRFFDIGADHYYYDDFANSEIIERVAYQSYIPMAHTLLEMIEQSNGEFKCAIAISGTALEQIQLYVPEFEELLKRLADSGCVEFLSGTYSHSLASLEDPEEFIREVQMHDLFIKRTLGVTPRVFANTELIYDDDVALLVKSMGFSCTLTEGAKHILGWKSPNYLYRSSSAPDLKLLLTNDKLALDIAANFNNPEWEEYPLTADKYISWIAALPEEEQVVNLYMSMDTFGTFIPASTGIFDFLKALPRFARQMGVRFATPSEVAGMLKPVAELNVPYPISDIDEARDVSAWKGNELQNEALRKLYAIGERVNLCTDRRLKKDWEYLQSSDHFFYMSTKSRADGASHAAFSPYDSPFSAFTNYMNVLADFTVRVEEQYPEEIGNEELNSLLLTIRNQAGEIESLKKEVQSLRAEDTTSDDKEATVSDPVPELPAPAKSAPAPRNARTAQAKTTTASGRTSRRTKKK